MRKFTHVNEEEYNRLKQLLNLEVKTQQLAEISKRGTTTLKRIKTSVDFPDYQRLTAEVGNRAKKVKEKPVEKTITYTGDLYRTKDLGLMSYLEAQNIGPLAVNLDELGRAFYQYDLTDEVKAHIDNFYNHAALVDPRTYFHAIRNVKARIYALKEGNYA